MAVCRRSPSSSIKIYKNPYSISFAHHIIGISEPFSRFDASAAQLPLPVRLPVFHSPGQRLHIKVVAPGATFVHAPVYTRIVRGIARVRSVE